MGWFRKKIEYPIPEAVAYVEVRIKTCDKRLESLDTKKIYFTNCYNRGILSLDEFNTQAGKVQEGIDKQTELKIKLTNLKEDFLQRKNNGVMKVFKSELKI